MFTLDTNILIYYAAGDRKVSEFILEKIKNNIPLFIPTIVVTEFLSFPKLKKAERELFSKLLRKFQILPLDFDVAEKASYFRRKYKAKLADSVVAATAYLTNSKLLTRNIKDFRKIREITVVEI